MPQPEFPRPKRGALDQLRSLFAGLAAALGNTQPQATMEAGEEREYRRGLDELNYGMTQEQMGRQRAADIRAQEGFDLEKREANRSYGLAPKTPEEMAEREKMMAQARRLPPQPERIVGEDRTIYETTPGTGQAKPIMRPQPIPEYLKAMLDASGEPMGNIITEEELQRTTPGFQPTAPLKAPAREDLSVSMMELYKAAAAGDPQAAQALSDYQEAQEGLARIRGASSAPNIFLPTPEGGYTGVPKTTVGEVPGAGKPTVEKEPTIGDYRAATVALAAEKPQYRQFVDPTTGDVLEPGGMTDEALTPEQLQVKSQLYDRFIADREAAVRKRMTPGATTPSPAVPAPKTPVPTPKPSVAAPTNPYRRR